MKALISFFRSASPNLVAATLAAQASDIISFNITKQSGASQQIQTRATLGARR
jgi:hypothetical protein